MKYGRIEISVGIFVLVAILVMVYMSLKIGKDTYKLGKKGYTLNVTFKSASGIKKESAVEMAGIPIGKVRGISLVNGKAKLILLIRPDVKLPRDSVAVIRSKGILGDKYVEILPGTFQGPVLKEGDTLERTEMSMDMDQLFKRVGAIAEDVQQVTRSLRESLGNEKASKQITESLENIRKLTYQLALLVENNSKDIRELTKNLALFSKDIRNSVENSKQLFSDALKNLDSASYELKLIMADVHKITTKISKGEGTIGKMLTDSKTADELNEAISSLKSISKKIDEGRGTLGRLINDEETADNISEALKSVNSYLSKLETYKTFLDYRGEYLWETGDVKSYFTLRLQPREDKFYLISLVGDPLGTTDEEETTITENVDGRVTRTVLYEEKRKPDELKFSAQIAKRYLNLVIRGGILESTGGVGMDFYLLDDKLRLSAEIFDFDSEHDPHLKAWIDYRFLQNLFVTGGIDNIFDVDGGRTFFLGGGIMFEDEDIKNLLGKIPLPGQ